MEKEATVGKLKQDELRVIIDDFVKEVEQKKDTGGVAPKKWVINFRNELKDRVEREIYYVPIDLLRFRKYNGRISSDVMSYEKLYCPIDETTEESQAVLRKFLAEKDPEKTEELKQTIVQVGQTDPAIITCDGFLINGNRRKMVFEKLLKEYHGKDEYKRMKVVILPGKDVPGGPPTIREIEELESRYQLQKEGKAEYSGFDSALSIRRKMKLGITLEQQLNDDPTIHGLPKKKFDKEYKRVQEDLLGPLTCVDKYLHYIGRDELYNTISMRSGDAEGRWQAFIDYSKSIYSKISDPKQRIKLGINEDEVGDIESIAFKIIRMREFEGIKAHQVMRNFPKYLKVNTSKQELFKLTKIDMNLPKAEMVDKDGKEMDLRDQDRKWQSKYKDQIQHHVKQAIMNLEYNSEKEKPLELLEAALNKLNHENMEPINIGVDKLSEAVQITEKIAKRANNLRLEFLKLQNHSDVFFKKGLSKKN